MSRSRVETGAAILSVSLIGILAAAFVFLNGWTLYYGDAEAHLNIARRIVDARAPGYSQIGTVWLPLPHLLLLPFAANDALWRSGLAGAIPSVICFIIAGAFLFSATRRWFDSATAAYTCLAVFALNPNVLYLSSIPMTEPVFFAAIFGLLWAIVRFLGDPSSLKWAVAGGVASLAASLTRYEGWFLIPFAALFFLLGGKSRRWAATFVFGAITSLGPLWWLAHNYYFFGNALEFYNGPGSAMGIYQRALDAGMARYPGDHDWPKALHYYATAVLEVSGAGMLVLAAVGAASTLRKRLYLPLFFLALPPLFYLWSMHSSQAPIFIPTLWPFSYYNTRYALAAFPLLVCCAGALVPAVPSRYRNFSAMAIVLVAILPWLVHLSKRQEESLCWRESRANSVSRRAWTRRAADILGQQYRRGTGIIIPFGDLIGILREAGIPQRESLHEGDGPAWMAAIANPRFFLHTEWAIAISGDPLATAIQKCWLTGPHYARIATIVVSGAPVIEIYRRD